MFIAAIVLTLGVSIEVDLGALINIARHKQPRAATVAGMPDVTCGIKVVGYHITGKPGQRFEYAGETFIIPSEGFIEVISLPRVTHYAVDGRKLPLDDGSGALDGFSFRWLKLPAQDASANRELPENEAADVRERRAE